MRVFVDLGNIGVEDPGWAIIREESVTWTLVAVFKEKEDAELFLKLTDRKLPSSFRGHDGLFMREVRLEEWPKR